MDVLIGLATQQRPIFDGAGYYAHRAGSRPDSYIDNNGTPPLQPPPARRFGPRVRSDPVMYSNNSAGPVYPSHGHQQSYDTVASAAVSANGSGATEPWGNSTDPSSENSSIDKVPQSSKPDSAESYSVNGFGGTPHFQGPILEEHGSGSPAYGQPGYGQSHPGVPGGTLPYQGNHARAPVPPQHGAQRQEAPRVLIKLGGSGNAISSSPSTTKSEKRKSWLQRRFSKSSK